MNLWEPAPDEDGAAEDTAHFPNDLRILQLAESAIRKWWWFLLSAVELPSTIRLSATANPECRNKTFVAKDNCDANASVDPAGR